MTASCCNFQCTLYIFLAATDQIKEPERLERFVIMGELSLDGSVRPIKGALPIAIKARKEGFEGLMVPVQNAREAAMVNNLNVYAIEHINDVVNFFNGDKKLTPVTVNTREEFAYAQSNFDIDFCDVKGQENIMTMEDGIQRRLAKILGSPEGASYSLKPASGIGQPLHPFSGPVSMDEVSIELIARRADCSTLRTLRF